MIGGSYKKHHGLNEKHHGLDEEGVEMVNFISKYKVISKENFQFC